MRIIEILKILQKYNIDESYPVWAGRDFNVAHSGISYAARNGTMAYGYYWRYK